MAALRLDNRSRNSPVLSSIYYHCLGISYKGPLSPWSERLWRIARAGSILHLFTLSRFLVRSKRSPRLDTLTLTFSFPAAALAPCGIPPDPASPPVWPRRLLQHWSQVPSQVLGFEASQPAHAACLPGPAPCRLSPQCSCAPNAPPAPGSSRRLWSIRTGQPPAPSCRPATQRLRASCCAPQSGRQSTLTRPRPDLTLRPEIVFQWRGSTCVLVSSARLHRQAFDKSTRHFLLQSFSSCFCEQPDICIYAQQHILLPVDTGPPPTSLLDIPRIPLLALHRNRPPSTVRHSPSSPCRHRQRPLRHHRRRPTRPTNRRPTAPNCEHFWVFLKSKSTSASTGRALGEASPAALRRFTSTIEFGIPAIARSFFLCPFQGSGAV